MKKTGYSFYGQPIGILCLDTKTERPIGHIKNAMTFNFPVRYKLVRGATIRRVVQEQDPSLLDPFIEAGRELESEGVEAITTSCGFLALFQKELAASLKVPVFTSSLLQISLIHSMLRKNDKIGIITADKERLTKRHLEACGWASSIPVTIVGMENGEEFRSVIIEERKLAIDMQKMKDEVVSAAKHLVEEETTVKAILLECTDLTAFSSNIKQVLGLPVFDIITLMNYVYASLV